MSPLITDWKFAHLPTAATLEHFNAPADISPLLRFHERLQHSHMSKSLEYLPVSGSDDTASSSGLALHHGFEQFFSGSLNRSSKKQLSIADELNLGISPTNAEKGSENNKGVPLFTVQVNTEIQENALETVSKLQNIDVIGQKSISRDEGNLEARALNKPESTTKNSNEAKKPNRVWRVLSSCSSSLKKKLKSSTAKQPRPKNSNNSWNPDELCKKCGRFLRCLKHRKNIAGSSGRGPNGPQPTAPLTPEQRAEQRRERHNQLRRLIEECRRRYPQGPKRPARTRPDRNDSDRYGRDRHGRDRYDRERLYGAAAGAGIGGAVVDTHMGAVHSYLNSHAAFSGLPSGYPTGHHFHAGHHGGGGSGSGYDDSSDEDLSSQLADLQSQGILPDGLSLDDAQAQLQQMLQGGQSVANTGDGCGCADFITQCFGNPDCSDCPDPADCCCCDADCIADLLQSLFQS